MRLNYCLKGWTTGTCGCEGTLGCLCGRSTPCSQFVAYRIESGFVNQVDVSDVVLVRLIADGGQQSVLYLNANTPFIQQQAVVSAFTGRCGGRLATIAQIAPIQLPPKLTSIQLIRQQTQAKLTVGQKFRRNNLKAVPFECQA